MRCDEPYTPSQEENFIATSSQSFAHLSANEEPQPENNDGDGDEDERYVYVPGLGWITYDEWLDWREDGWD